MKMAIAALAASLMLVGCGGQSPECAKYISCQNKVDATAGALLDSSYGTNGSCWKSNADVANACTTACKTATAALATAKPDIAECK